MKEDKESILRKIINFFNKNGKKELKLPEGKEKKNEIIEKAKEAYEKYNLNTDPDIGKRIYDLITERIKLNQDMIEELIKILKKEITYSRIIEIVKEEKEMLGEYKKAEEMIKIDEIFIYSSYQVPVGIIGVETDEIEEVIRNILRGITTRNGIIILEEKYNKHGLENLILFIVKEALKKLEIDENIVQIVKKEEIQEEEREEIDLIIKNGEKEERKEYEEKMYIYEEDEYFKKVVEEEIKRLKKEGKEVIKIKDNIENTIKKINEKRIYGANIYTKDRKKAYKFINLVKGKNVFFNATLENAKETKESENMYFTMKNLICEYKI